MADITHQSQDVMVMDVLQLHGRRDCVLASTLYRFTSHGATVQALTGKRSRIASLCRTKPDEEIAQLPESGIGRWCREQG
jgi:hypothetical protein